MVDTKQHTSWKIIKLYIKNPNEIINIENKLPAHIEEINSISILCVPTVVVEKSYSQIGEISLSFNNSKEHIIHCNTSFSKVLPNNSNQSLNINAQLLNNSIITGYYRDNGTFKNQREVFIPYHLKILMECKINS